MTRQPRVLNETDVKEIIEDLRKELNLCSERLDREGKTFNDYIVFWSK